MKAGEGRLARRDVNAWLNDSHSLLTEVLVKERQKINSAIDIRAAM